MGQPPNLLLILPHLIAPGVMAAIMLLWARRRGASWTQVQLAFGAAMLSAFMTASGWVFAAYISGSTPSPLRILASQILVAAATGLLVLFGTMPVEQDLTGLDEAPPPPPQP